MTINGAPYARFSTLIQRDTHMYHMREKITASLACTKNVNLCAFETTHDTVSHHTITGGEVITLYIIVGSVTIPRIGIKKHHDFSNHTFSYRRISREAGKMSDCDLKRWLPILYQVCMQPKYIRGY